jgi:hypothetical protein
VSTLIKAANSLSESFCLNKEFIVLDNIMIFRGLDVPLPARFFIIALIFSSLLVALEIFKIGISARFFPLYILIVFVLRCLMSGSKPVFFEKYENSPPGPASTAGPRRRRCGNPGHLVHCLKS